MGNSSKKPDKKLSIFDKYTNPPEKILNTFYSYFKKYKKCDILSLRYIHRYNVKEERNRLYELADRNTYRCKTRNFDRTNMMFYQMMIHGSFKSDFQMMKAGIVGLFGNNMNMAFHSYFSISDNIEACFHGNNLIMIKEIRNILSVTRITYHRCILRTYKNSLEDISSSSLKYIPPGDYEMAKTLCMNMKKDGVFYESDFYNLKLNYILAYVKRTFTIQE